MVSAGDSARLVVDAL